VDGKVRVWDNDLAPLKQFDASPLGVISVATNAYGMHLFLSFVVDLSAFSMQSIHSLDVACTTMDGKLKVWEIESGNKKQELSLGCGMVNCGEPVDYHFVLEFEFERMLSSTSLFGLFVSLISSHLQAMCG
jgi:hypothetical protein